MAVDTRDKRAGATMPTLPWRTQFPLPNFSIGILDRPIIATLYPIISATSLNFQKTRLEFEADKQAIIADPQTIQFEADKTVIIP